LAAWQLFKDGRGRRQSRAAKMKRQNPRNKLIGLIIVALLLLLGLERKFQISNRSAISVSQTEIAKLKSQMEYTHKLRQKKHFTRHYRQNSHRGSLKRTFLPQYKIPGNASTEYLNKS